MLGLVFDLRGRTRVVVHREGGQFSMKKKKAAKKKKK